ncbi:hypothetical protein GCM10011498_22510 [Amylibacter cionae]|uniref:Cytochrome c domain-containing protein n=1 Tax=Neptunicoccus cionae TaxID=2035344 RepID=A0A916QYC4_9RHOB|nr:hypothetical protein GCM10011498_22510 [Amylibacter cionae]
MRKLSPLKRISRSLHIGERRRGEDAGGKGKFTHWIVLYCAGLFAGVAQAQELPKALVAGDFAQYPANEVAFGRALFFDPVLSGNRNISCATCHNPRYGGSDGQALGIGEGGTGHGAGRQMGQAVGRQARNAPALWDLGARQVRRLFHDGRVEWQGAVIRSPAGELLPEGLNGLLAAQVLFPLIARMEMGGHPKSNEIAAAAQQTAPQAWDRIADRVAAIAGYREMAGHDDINIALLANALAAYISTAFRSTGSAFDRYLEGESTALTADQRDGMALFYGVAQCSQCHSGPLLSDQTFHNLAMPPLGPGRIRRFDPVARDTGRLAVSDDVRDSYRFRTPFLRNVAHTAPYGHNGAFPTLRAVIWHHMDPLVGLADFIPPDTMPHWQDVTELNRIRAAFLAYPRAAQVPATLDSQQIDQLIHFLHSLSAPSSSTLSRDQMNLQTVPDTVPSGLTPVGD